MATKQTFDLLHLHLQKWIYCQKWTEFRPVQQKAIPPILKGNTDVVIRANTASGKTEAAFLPACTRVLQERPNSVGILYIAPLKALINDQTLRLESMLRGSDLLVTPWHGDILQTQKNRLLRFPSGVLLITPESLESRLSNEPLMARALFESLMYVILDEIHVYPGTERGVHVQSLLCRLEALRAKGPIPRIALSATIGNVERLKQFVRPADMGYPIVDISSSANPMDLRVAVKGAETPSQTPMEEKTADEEILNDLYRVFRNSTNLVFTNTRQRAEWYGMKLRDRCEAERVPNEFFVHHGNLDKSVREEVEDRLRKGKEPTTVLCTMTLELGIDIGAVDAIAQITPPGTVASLRQRVGRAGRREKEAVLICYIPEVTKSEAVHLTDVLRLQTVQMIAMLELIREKWVEATSRPYYHFSTLVHQVLSVTKQYGSISVKRLYELLCKKGPFRRVTPELFKTLLRSMGDSALLTQMTNGELVIGDVGERVTGHYTFHSAFQTPKEYRLIYQGRFLGTLPIVFPLIAGYPLTFGGTKWLIVSVDERCKEVLLGRAEQGKPPVFGGSGQWVDHEVRQKMYEVYCGKGTYRYLDERGRSHLEQGRAAFRELGLKRRRRVSFGETTYLFPWSGDRLANTLVALINGEGPLLAENYQGVVQVSRLNEASLLARLQKVTNTFRLSETELASRVLDTMMDKFDVYVPKSLRQLAYGDRWYDVEGAYKWLDLLAYCGGR